MQIFTAKRTRSSMVCASIITLSLAGGHASGQSPAEAVAVSDIEWGALNPARGDASPRAADLWGDRGEDQATGFLVKFRDGFSSPPHIHNVTYRGVVVRGLVHNDDPNAAPMWMSPGSFWTQPAGESHITSARNDGAESIAYIEIQAGPYLVKPTDEAFDNGERPINVHTSNLIWLDATELLRIESSTGSDGRSGVKIAFLWGVPDGDEPSGTLLKLPAGFKGELRGSGSPLRAVVIAGELRYSATIDGDPMTMPPGSYFGSSDQATHRFTTSEQTIVYLRTAGRYTVVAANAAP